MPSEPAAGWPRPGTGTRDPPGPPNRGSRKRLRIRVLSRAEIGRLVRAAEGGPEPLRDVAILSVAYSTAARVGELAGMVVGGLESRDEAGTWLRWWRPKTRDEHELRLNPVAADRLDAYLLQRCRRGGLWRLDPAAPLFRSRKGGPAGGPFRAGGPSDRREGPSDRPLTCRGFQHLLRRTAAAAGFPAHRATWPHVLRHSRITHLIEAGCGLAVAQAVAGHANIATTNDYLHVAASIVGDSLRDCWHG